MGEKVWNSWIMNLAYLISITKPRLLGRSEAILDIENEPFSFCSCYLGCSILLRRMGKCQERWFLKPLLSRCLVRCCVSSLVKKSGKNLWCFTTYSFRRRRQWNSREGISFDSARRYWWNRQDCCHSVDRWWIVSPPLPPLPPLWSFLQFWNYLPMSLPDKSTSF